MEFISTSEEETKKIAKKLAKTLKGGEVLALYGDLGAGKTSFVQGLALGLGIKKRVLSPTFVLIRSYPLKGKNFYHVDLYRIQDNRETTGLNLEEFLGKKDTITTIEWAEKAENLLPENTVKIYFEIVAEEKRRIKVA